jgi:two-component system, OmpR family, sensor histidine kinase ChvG
MSLRSRFLLVALSTLALPWAGWLILRQTAALLRDGQQQALTASAQMLAMALAASGVEAPAAGPVLYVERALEPVSVDGYGDEWSALRPYAQVLGPPEDAHKLDVLLARRGGDLYLLASVRDATRTRVDAGDPRAADSDHVVLLIGQGAATVRYRLASAAPGRFDARAIGDAAPWPDRIPAAWQEDGSGYRVELRLPRDPAPARIGVAVHDAALGASQPPEPRRLLDYDEAAARTLAPLVPAHARARIVSADGWVLADAGHADAARGVAGSRFADLVYRGLTPAFGGSADLDGAAPRLDATEVWQALSGVDATSWRAGSQEGAVVLAAAVPLEGRGGPRGALLLEQASRALPLLANRALFGLAGASLAALAIAGALLLAFGASLSLRIRRLRDAAERAVRLSGRLDGPLPLVGDGDELGDLARSFGKLVDEVGAYTGYLRALASRLSHELNTPLAIVKSSLDNLDHEPLAGPARAYLGRARDGADRLGAIVRAMSESNRIERALAGAEAEDFDLAALVGGCAEGYRPLAAPRDLRLALPPHVVPFHGAPELVAQALDKLFDNACSFTPADGWIALSLEVQGGTPVISVANSGPPLPPAMQERLFDSLVSLREGAARSGPVPHLGLGLYIVRLVAELHRGSAAARDLAAGAGVEFELRMAGMPRRPLTVPAGVCSS